MKPRKRVRDITHEQLVEIIAVAAGVSDVFVTQQAIAYLLGISYMSTQYLTLGSRLARLVTEKKLPGCLCGCMVYLERPK